MSERMQDGDAEVSPEHAAVLIGLRRFFNEQGCRDNEAAVGKVDPHAEYVAGMDVRLHKCAEATLIWCLRFKGDDERLDFGFGERVAYRLVDDKIQDPDNPLSSDATWNIAYAIANTDWVGKGPID